MTDAVRRARIMMVTPRFRPYRGGVETHAYEVGRRIAADPSFEVTVISTDLEHRAAPIEQMDGMRIERLPAHPSGADLYWSPDVYRRILADPPDLLHVQGYHTLLPGIALLAARRIRLPYVVTLHSGGHSSSIRNIVRPIQVRLMRPLLRSAAAVVAVSRWEADHFGGAHGLGSRNLVVIPNGADFGEAAGSDATRDPNLVLSVARLERYKGHQRVIGAMPHVQRSNPAARLRIVGEGPYEDELRALVLRRGLAGSVEFVSVPRDEILRLLGEASVVALLSEYESHGLAVHEALASGCRVVVDGRSALSEVVGLDQVSAVSRSDGDEAVAAALIDQLGRGPVPPGSVPALPTWDDCAAAVATLYRSVLAGTGTRRDG